jgi:hypothetical protein
MSNPTRRALLGNLAAGVATPLAATTLAATSLAGTSLAIAADALPFAPPRIARAPSRIRPGFPIALALEGADAVTVDAGEGVLEAFESKEFLVSEGACAFNAPVLLAVGSWAALVCRPLRREAGGHTVWGAPVTVWVQALPRHFGA